MWILVKFEFWLISIDQSLTLTLGRPISNMGMVHDPIIFHDVNLGPVYQQYRSDLMISIDHPLTSDLDLLVRPISNIGKPLFQVSWPYLVYFLRYEFGPSLNYGWSDIQTSGRTDIQTVMYKSPPCHWHRWAQKEKKEWASYTVGDNPMAVQDWNRLGRSGEPLSRFLQTGNTCQSWIKSAL